MYFKPFRHPKQIIPNNVSRLYALFNHCFLLQNRQKDASSSLDSHLCNFFWPTSRIIQYRSVPPSLIFFFANNGTNESHSAKSLQQWFNFWPAMTIKLRSFFSRRRLLYTPLLKTETLYKSIENHFCPTFYVCVPV